MNWGSNLSCGQIGVKLNFKSLIHVEHSLDPDVG
jgi:hypothetical protein